MLFQGRVCWGKGKVASGGVEEGSPTEVTGGLEGQGTAALTGEREQALPLRGAALWLSEILQERGWDWREMRGECRHKEVEMGSSRVGGRGRTYEIFILFI